MQILRFPKTITIRLSDLERLALESILNRNDSYRDDEHLVRHVLGAGIAALLGDGADEYTGGDDIPSVAARMEQRLKDVARDVEGDSELSTAAGFRPFPKITKRYRDPRKEHVENYVATVIPKHVQDRLQTFLDTNPEADLEALLATLIGVGLDRVEKDPKILSPDPAEEFAKLDRSSPPVTASIIEDELALEDRLRKKLTKFLAAHPDAMKREHARRLLADLGARRG